MTLMPVTRIADSVDWSTNSGALAWIGLRLSALTGPRSSIGSPITLTMRPRVCGPTGTEICWPVLRWPVTSRTALKDGLYLYDAIGRVQEINARQGEEPDIGEFVHLGPLGTALLPYERPRVLVIDELDKSDIDLPNDLLNVFEEGEFEIPELSRLAARHPEVTVLTDDRDGAAVVRRGRVRCRSFPLVIITSNGEREFPAPFLRRCLKLHVDPPTFAQLGAMVAAQFGETDGVDISRLITDFMERSEATGGLASDQLLNAVHMAMQPSTSGAYLPDGDWQELLTAIWHPLSSTAEG